MRNLFRVVLFGALFGGALSTWISPSVISWYFTPPAQVEFSCVAPIKWALSRLQMAQAFGIGLGAILGMVVWLTLRPRQKTIAQKTVSQKT